ncbi:MAG: sulfite exporter TauE/SafE family protein [Desulfovibrio sp.]
MIEQLITYALLGAVAGILAGLFGIGGGLVIVPMLVLAFEWQGMDPNLIMKVALGTSLATIIFTSVSSTLAHNKRGAVLWKVVLGIAPGILIGTFLGAYSAHWLPTKFLQIFFTAFLYYVAWTMFTGKKPPASRTLPGNAGMFGAGNFIGLISSWVGIGGGTLSVPFLLWCNTSIHAAIGTASAIGFFIAVSGTLGYVLGGWGVVGVPGPSLGYISIPVMLGIVCVSVLTAPLGAKLAHSLDTKKLKRIFACLLIVVATRMLLKVAGIM